MKGFPVGCWYATSGDCRAVTDPAWTGGPHPCDVGSWHTRQRFAKPLYAPGHWSLILFILPHLCVSVFHKAGLSQCDHQCAAQDFYSFPSSADWSQSKPKQENAPSHASPGRCYCWCREEKVLLCPCLQLSCQSHSSWLGPGHWCFSHQKADLVKIRQLQILFVSAISSL